MYTSQSFPQSPTESSSQADTQHPAVPTVLHTAAIDSTAESRLIASLHRGVRFSLSQKKALYSAGLAFSFDRSEIYRSGIHTSPSSFAAFIAEGSFARSFLIGCHRFKPRPQLQSRRLPPSDATDRVLQSLSPIEFDACQFSIRPSPVEKLRKHLQISRLKCHDQLNWALRLLPSILFSSKFHSPPLFSLVERGVPQQPQALPPAAGKMWALRFPLPDFPATPWTKAGI